MNHPSHPARVLAAAQRAWIADTLERLPRAIGHRAPARTTCQLLMLQTGVIFGVAIDDAAGLDDVCLEAWDRLVGFWVPMTGLWFAPHQAAAPRPDFQSCDACAAGLGRQH
jgi:hypothetical protein